MAEIVSSRDEAPSGTSVPNDSNTRHVRLRGIVLMIDISQTGVDGIHSKVRKGKLAYGIAMQPVAG